MSLRIVFMGSPELAVTSFKALHKAFEVVGVLTQPDKPRGRSRKAKPTAVKEAALEAGIPVAEPEDLGSAQTSAILTNWAPDVIVVAAYGKMLPKHILELPHMGCVNLHASLLPRHRGASPISGAILAGDKFTGVSTMLMDEGMDTGDILLTTKVAIMEDDTTESLHDKLLTPGAELVVETLQQMADKTIEPTPQDHTKATYTKILKKEDGHIDWNRPATYLDRLIRAMNSWPGAFAYFQGEMFKIWRASPALGSALVGTIHSIGDDGIEVGTGQGVLILKEVQAPGKKRISAVDFARGRRVKVGDMFDLG